MLGKMTLAASFKCRVVCLFCVIAQTTEYQVSCGSEAGTEFTQICLCPCLLNEHQPAPVDLAWFICFNRW